MSTSRAPAPLASTRGTPSLRSLFIILFSVIGAYGIAVYSGIYFLGLQQSQALQASAAPLRQELVQLSSAQVALTNLVNRALSLDDGDKDAAQSLIDTLGALELENAAIQAQRRLALQAALREALSRMARPESALPIRIRELCAAILLGDANKLIEVRGSLLDARSELISVTREFELLALQELQRREELLEERIQSGIQLLGIASLAGGLLLIGILSVLRRRVLDPIDELQQAITSVQSGDLEQQLDPARTDELGRLALMFNRMSETLRMRAALEAEQRQAITEDLKRSEHLFAEVLHRASELIVVLDSQQQVMFLGPTWSRIANLSDEPTGKQLANLLPEEHHDAIEDAVHGAQLDGESTLRLTLDLEDGETRAFDFVFSRLDTSSGRTLAVGRDITRVLAVEAKRQHTSRLEAIGQVTGGVAHDFNNLLLVMRGNLELLDVKTRGPISDGRPHSELQEAMDAIDRAAALTSSLLAYSRKQKLKAEPVDLQMLLNGLGSWVRRVLTPRINLEVECSTALLINVDRAQLENAILNLAINARDAMPDGGNLTLKAERVEDIRGTHSETPSHADYVELSVRDTGTGMSEDVIARAFEPFFTTKELGNGSGLGLSMVQGFVQQSGGSVSIDSTAGQGTTFCLRFPGFAGAATALPALSIPDAAPNTKAAPPARILVVEDEDGVRRIAVNMLASLGYTVHAVSTAEEALAYIGDETTAPCELVFSDVLLAGGMDGAELGRRLARTHPSLPVLLTSGHPREALARHRGLAQFGLLMKPYDRNELRSAIELAMAAAA